MTYNQGSRWDKGEFLKRKPVSAEYKKAIADYYQAGLKTGKSSEDLLAELAERYGRSTRTIQRYIRGVIKPQEVTGNKTEVESEITPLPTQVTGEDDREHSLSMYMESVSDNGQEKSGAHSAPFRIMTLQNPPGILKRHYPEVLSVHQIFLARCLTQIPYT